MFCSNCGNQLADDAKFCGKCGTPVDTFDEPVASSEPVLETPIMDVPVQPVQPMVNTYEQPVPVQVEPVQAAPVQAAPVQPIQPIPVQPVQSVPVQATPVQPVQPVPVQATPVQQVQPEPVQVNLVKEEPVQPAPAANPYEQPVPVENPYEQPVPVANPYEQPVPAANPFEQPVADPFAQAAPVPAGNPFDQPNQAENPFAANTPVQSGNPFGDVTAPQQPGSFVPTQPMEPFGAAPEQMNQFENKKSKAPLIIGIISGVVLIAVAVILFLFVFKDDGKDKDKDEKNTTKTEGSIDESTEEPTSDSGRTDSDVGYITDDADEAAEYLIDEYLEAISEFDLEAYKALFIEEVFEDDFWWVDDGATDEEAIREMVDFYYYCEEFGDIDDYSYDDIELWNTMTFDENDYYGLEGNDVISEIYYYDAVVTFENSERKASFLASFNIAKRGNEWTIYYVSISGYSFTDYPYEYYGDDEVDEFRAEYDPDYDGPTDTPDSPSATYIAYQDVRFMIPGELVYQEGETGYGKYANLEDGTEELIEGFLYKCECGSINMTIEEAYGKFDELVGETFGTIEEVEDVVVNDYEMRRYFYDSVDGDDEGYAEVYVYADDEHLLMFVYMAQDGVASRMDTIVESFYLEEM